MNQDRWRWMMDLEDQASRVKSSLKPRARAKSAQIDHLSSGWKPGITGKRSDSEADAELTPLWA